MGRGLALKGVHNEVGFGAVILFRQQGYSHDTVFFVFRLHNDSKDGGWRSGTTLQAGVWISGGLNFTKDISNFSLHLLPSYSNCSDR